LVKVCIFVESL